jgi:hypothetical protein
VPAPGPDTGSYEVIHLGSTDRPLRAAATSGELPSGSVPDWLTSRTSDVRHVRLRPEKADLRSPPGSYLGWARWSSTRPPGSWRTPGMPRRRRTGKPGRRPARPGTCPVTRCGGGWSCPGEPSGHRGGEGDQPGGRVPRWPPGPAGGTLASRCPGRTGASSAARERRSRRAPGHAVRLRRLHRDRGRGECAKSEQC